MAEIADFLPQDDELGAQLRGNASEFRAQLAASVAACTVPANASGFAHPLMLPPFARKRGEFAVFRNMTKDVRAPIEAHDLASYTNCTCPFFSAFPDVLMKLPAQFDFGPRCCWQTRCHARSRWACWLGTTGWAVDWVARLASWITWTTSPARKLP